MATNQNQGLQGPLMYIFKPDKWKKAYFSLKKSKIYGYDDPKFTRKFKSWSLAVLKSPYNVCEANAKNEDHLFAFQIILPTETVYLGASTVKVRDQWITAMHNMVRQHLPTNPLLAEAKALLATPNTPNLLTQTVEEHEAEELIGQAVDDQMDKIDLANLNLEEGSLDRLINGKISARLPKLKCIDLSGSRFTTLPKDVPNLRYLTSLFISDCKLTEWPIELRNLRKLIELDLSGNQIGLIPEDIGYLTSLEILKLQGNHLTSMNEAIGCLRNLEEFYLSENPRFRTITPALGECRNLRKIHVNKCNLSRIPVELTYLFQLGELQLSHNIIEELPPTLGRLSALYLLDVSNNKLSTLPPSIAQCIKLVIHDGIRIEGNMLKDIKLIQAYNNGTETLYSIYKN